VTGWGLGVMVSVVLMDRTTKALAQRRLSPLAAAPPTAAGLLELRSNGGWWWSRRPPAAPFLVALWILALGCAASVVAFSGPSLASIALGAAVAGASSNLWDRLGRGAVTDFIALGRWPSFNLADVAIVAGVALALVSVT
jgi:signal peptidase II